MECDCKFLELSFLAGLFNFELGFGAPQSQNEDAENSLRQCSNHFAVSVRNVVRKKIQKLRNPTKKFADFDL